VGPVISDLSAAGWANIGSEQWGTHRGEQEGDPPWRIERGRGKVFPFLSNPIGSLRKPRSEEIMGPTWNISIEM
jgi:hypothetical protein